MVGNTLSLPNLASAAYGRTAFAYDCRESERDVTNSLATADWYHTRAARMDGGKGGACGSVNMCKG
jgi:hypothetical protein